MNPGSCIISIALRGTCCSLPRKQQVPRAANQNAEDSYPVAAARGMTVSRRTLFSERLTASSHPSCQLRFAQFIPSTQKRSRASQMRVSRLSWPSEEPDANIRPELFSKIVSSVERNARAHRIGKVSNIPLVGWIVRSADAARSGCCQNFRSVEALMARIGARGQHSCD